VFPLQNRETIGSPVPLVNRPFGYVRLNDRVGPEATRINFVRPNTLTEFLSVTRQGLMQLAALKRD
jgi:hypothetical protein